MNETLTAKRDAWLKETIEKLKLGNRDIDVLRRATNTLIGNLIDSPDNAWGPYRGIVPSPRTYKGVWNWDSAFHALAVSRFDPDLAYEQFAIFFANQGDDGIFPDVIRTDGSRMDTYSKPPVMAWAFARVYRRAPRPDLLPDAYAHFVKNEGFWANKRCDEKTGLFYYDALHVGDEWRKHQKWESGMDTSPRWDNGVDNLLAVDLNGFMVTFYDALADMADRLGKKDESDAWRQKRDALAQALDTTLWSDEAQSYLDRDRFTGQFSDVTSSVFFVPLFAGAASPEHAAAMAKRAADPKEYFPSMPSVAMNHPTFSAGDYWRGPVWLNYAWFAAQGLRAYGYDKLAADVRRWVLSTVHGDAKTIYEYYNPITREGLGAKEFGWSCAFCVEFICSD